MPFDTPRIPIATYRLQFGRDFGFAAARGIVDYLAALGISDLYASPYFKARAGSDHGYDVVDPNALNPELGSEEDYAALTAELERHGLGQLLDLVPNHMCVASSDNEWWADLLENGPSARHARFFDVDWAPIKQELRDKVLFPILGDQYGTVLEKGELRLVFEEGAFFLDYFEHRLPIMPKSYGALLGHRLEALAEELGADHDQFQELLSIATALEHLPPHTESDPRRIVERYREKEIVKRRLAALCRDCPPTQQFIAANVALFNGEPGVPASFDLLDDLLRRQAFRLSHWRVATEEINYRRFFDINALAAIRMEDRAVFAATHRLVLRLVREGRVTGLRIDHLDGLYDPLGYLERLQRRCFVARGLAALEAESGPLGDDGERRQSARLLRCYRRLRRERPGLRPFFVVGEKILGRGEKLPEEWPLFGATGYDFANQACGLLVATENARAFDALYARFTGLRGSFAETVYQARKLVMQASMSGEINALGYRLNTLSEDNRHTRDFTLISLIKALVEVIAFFPVYRTYCRGRQVGERDRRYVEFAVARAKRRNPATDPSIFDFVRQVLLLEGEGGTQAGWRDFVMRFQQLTGPVAAKGVEDTAFYLYNRLLALNEVGGSPERFGLSLEAFHGQNLERCKSRPLALLATSTHDTKRSEDVRARIAVLSEIPGTWRAALGRWSRQNRRKKTLVDGQPVPDANEEYLLYQTLLGAWPFEPATAEEFAAFRRRIGDYLRKAAREAKVNSSWIRPNAEYEEALVGFVERLLENEPGNRFLADLRQFQQQTSYCGMLNSLTQTLLKLTSPGIPDVYQGCELWDLSLVDPDNRRPVDFVLRRRLVDELREQEAAGLLPLAQELTASMADGRIKLFVTRQALALRHRQRELFTAGDYLPLAVQGPRAENLCAFLRCSDHSAALVVAPRLFTRLVPRPGVPPLGAAVWGETRLLLPAEAGPWRFGNLFTGEPVVPQPCDDGFCLSLAEVLADFPIALLEAEPTSVAVAEGQGMGA